MVNSVHLRLNANDRSYFAILKKEIHALAASAGFSAKRLAEIDIVVAEIVSNLFKHAVDGEVLVKLVEEKGIQGIEIISIDSGPGIPDVRLMMQDGTSTKNTLGHGLGAIKRLSDFFQIYSLKDWGTLLLVRIFNEEITAVKKKALLDARSLLVAKPNETACGDGFYFKQSKDYVKIFLGDGLGHGKEAEFAVQKAIDAFRMCDAHNPHEILRDINVSVKKTRGLVATIAVFNIKDRCWKVCGVGNITSKFYGNTINKNHNPYNGIVGLNMPNSMNDQEIKYEPGQLLVMCSDGIKSKWDFLKFPGIQRYDLSLLDAAIFKDFARNTDDMSVASCKINV